MMKDRIAWSMVYLKDSVNVLFLKTLLGSTIVGVAFLEFLLVLLGIEWNTRTLQTLMKKMDSSTNFNKDTSQSKDMD